MHSNKLSMLHPGRIILEEFLEPKGISVFRLAKEIGVSPRRIYEIVQGQRSISADIAHRLAHYFGMSERYWLGLQARYNLSAANDVYRKITVNRCLTIAK
jgi:addiction module HigA family antidote